MDVYYFKEDVRNVTELYYEIILRCLEKNGVKIHEIDKSTSLSILSIPKSQYILLTTLKSFLILYTLGYRNFIYWYQGITPEEDYMVHHILWRRWLFTYAEKKSLTTVKYKIGVSKYQFEHYNKKYDLRIKIEDCFIMPCFNSGIFKKSFFVEGKYKRNIFCYAGSMETWQWFEETVRIYKEIEDNRDDVFLKILSKDKCKSQEIIDKYDIKHYSINSVPHEQMNKELSECKFGFILREDNIVNNVATPTKIGTYIGNGVIPIFTPAIKSFAELSKGYKYLCCVDPHNPVQSILQFINFDVDANDVYEEYNDIFVKYYNKEFYVSKLKEFLKLIAK